MSSAEGWDFVPNQGPKLGDHRIYFGFWGDGFQGRTCCRVGFAVQGCPFKSPLRKNRPVLGCFKWALLRYQDSLGLSILLMRSRKGPTRCCFSRQSHGRTRIPWLSSGWLLGLQLSGFFNLSNIDLKSLTFRRGSEVKAQAWQHKNAVRGLRLRLWGKKFLDLLHTSRLFSSASQAFAVCFMAAGGSIRSLRLWVADRGGAWQTEPLQRSLARQP